MSALSDIVVPAVGDPDTTGPKSIPNTFGSIKAFRDQLAAAVPDDGWLSWTPHLVVNDANAGNSFIPSTGANPILGTGSRIEGRYIKAFGLVVARATIIFGANSSSVTRTDMATNTATDRFTRSAAHGYTNGMAVIPTNLGATTLGSPSLNQDGSYYVVDVGGGGGNDLQIAQIPGGSAVLLNGSNATGVTLTAVAANPGSGPYRVNLPVPCSAAENNAYAMVGHGQLYNDSVALATFGLGPNVYKSIDLHTTTGIGSGMAGLINIGGLPITQLAAGNYALTNHTDSRSLDENSGLVSNTKLVSTGAATAVSGSTFTDSGATFGTNLLGKRISLGTYDGVVLRRVSGTQLDLGIAHGQSIGAAYNIYRDDVTAVSHVLGTLINDLAALVAENVLVDVSDSSPFLFAPNDAIQVRLMYEAA